jgi:hypothetical protein
MCNVCRDLIGGTECIQRSETVGNYFIDLPLKAVGRNPVAPGFSSHRDLNRPIAVGVKLPLLALLAMVSGSTWLNHIISYT